MRLNSFLGLVEIRTKAASIIPCMLGTIYALYRFQIFNTLNFCLFFGSLIAIDMTTTALNNYLDYKRAYKKHGYNYEVHNAIVKHRLKDTTVVAVIVVMLSAAVILGIILVMNTNIIVLFIGALSFFVGIIYSFGPVPISRTPFGELFSGFFMGFVIVFLSIYIHVFNGNIVSIKIDNYNLTFNMNMVEVIYIFLFSLPVLCGIANIMLANNICDIEDDTANKRYTLPVFIGRKYALEIFGVLYYIAYVDMVILSLLKLVPYVCLITLLTLVPVYKNIRAFSAKHIKKETFILSVRNFFLMSVPFMIIFWIAWLIM